MKKLLALILTATIFVGGFLFGQHHASLHNVTADGYQINFNGQIHDYY
jgi:hypothetical protein